MIVEKRADGKVETEATIKIWVGGERYVRTAEGNGPVHALDQALRDAIGENSHPPEGHRARQLQGPHPRRDQGHRRGHPRAARRLRRPRGVGLHRVSTNVIAASWEALVDSLEYGCSPGESSTGARRARCPRRERRTDPARAARHGRGRGAGVLEVLRSGRLSLARRCRRSRMPLQPPGSASRTRARSPAARRACTWRCARSGLGWRRGRHLAVLVRRLGQRHRLRARAAGVRRHRPGDAQPRPAAPPPPR